MQLKIQKINLEIIKESENFFGEFFCENLKKEKLGTYEESLVARYLLEKDKQETKNPCYSSISHKKNLVFVWTHNKKIWVDIEIFKLRDKSILEDFFKKEKTKKTWEKFYTLWTAKESIIKIENLKLDDMKKIILLESEKINKKISWINFEKKLIFSFKNKNFVVYSWKKENLFYSVCI